MCWESMTGKSSKLACSAPSLLKKLEALQASKARDDDPYIVTLVLQKSGRATQHYGVAAVAASVEVLLH